MKYTFPLSWPIGWPRTKSRRRSPFKVAGDRARAELEATVRLIGGSSAHLISSNVHVSSLGRPYAEELGRQVGDPGVAVYWTRKGASQVVACDLYPTPGENMRALGLALDGLRAMERSGIAGVVDRAFAGFAQLPSSTKRPWWEVLELAEDASLESAEIAYRGLASTWHPDVPGGSAEKMIDLNAAITEARRARGKR